MLLSVASAVLICLLWGRAARELMAKRSGWASCFKWGGRACKWSWGLWRNKAVWVHRWSRCGNAATGTLMSHYSKTTETNGIGYIIAVFCWETSGCGIHMDVTLIPNTYLNIVADHPHSTHKECVPSPFHISRTAKKRKPVLSSGAYLIDPWRTHSHNQQDPSPITSARPHKTPQKNRFPVPASVGQSFTVN